TRSPEPAVVNPANPFILDAHLAAAAYERPLAPEDDDFWGEDLEEAVGRLVKDDVDVLRNGRAVYAGRGSPAAKIGLRTGSPAEVRIVAGPGGRWIGVVGEE